MKIQHLGFCMILGLASSVALTEPDGNNLASAASASGPSYSLVQSSYRPSDWQLWDPVLGQVQTCNSDANSQDFMANQPSFMQIVNAKVSEGMKYAAASQNPVDVQRLGRSGGQQLVHEVRVARPSNYRGDHLGPRDPGRVGAGAVTRRENCEVVP